jgi:hypothetical protein
VTFPEALRLLNLPHGTKPEDAHPHWKDQTVAATHAENHELLRLLSQAKQAIKRRTLKRCTYPGCNNPTSGERCSIHLRNTVAMKNETRIPAVTNGVSEIESGVEVTHAVRSISSPIAEAIRKLRDQGKVGDSFTAFIKAPSNVATIAKREGVQIITRKVYPEKTDPTHNKRKLCRIWRSDGKTADELNRIIHDQNRE